MLDYHVGDAGVFQGQRYLVNAFGVRQCRYGSTGTPLKQAQLFDGGFAGRPAATGHQNIRGNS